MLCEKAPESGVIGRVDEPHLRIWHWRRTRQWRWKAPDHHPVASRSDIQRNKVRAIRRLGILYWGNQWGRQWLFGFDFRFGPLVGFVPFLGVVRSFLLISILLRTVFRFLFNPLLGLGPFLIDVGILSLTIVRCRFSSHLHYSGHVPGRWWLGEIFAPPYFSHGSLP